MFIEDIYNLLILIYNIYQLISIKTVFQMQFVFMAKSTNGCMINYLTEICDWLTIVWP